MLKSPAPTSPPFRFAHAFLVGLLLAAVAALLTNAPTARADDEPEQSYPAMGQGKTTRGVLVDLNNLPPGSGEGIVNGPPPFDPIEARELAAKKAELAKLDRDHAPLSDRAPDVHNAESMNAPDAKAPALLTNFQGFARDLENNDWFPPDPNLAVGANGEMVSVVNSRIRIFFKDGRMGSDQSLAAFMGNQLPDRGTGFKIFDPHALYEPFGNRWIVIAAATRESDHSSYFLLAISDDDVALSGTWCVRAMNMRLHGAKNVASWADYPAIGSDTQTINVTANMFKWDGGFLYSKLRVLDKAAAYGPCISEVPFYEWWKMENTNGGVNVKTLMPSISYNPAKPGYLVNSLENGGSQLNLWFVTNPLGPNPSLDRHKVKGDPGYTLPANAKAKGKKKDLDTGDNRLLNAIIVEGYLWTTHTVACYPGSDATRRACAQWYAIRLSKRDVTQTGRVGTKGGYYFYPGIAVNKSNNVIMVLSYSDENRYAETRFTGRKVTDAPNTMRATRLLRAGENTYRVLDDEGGVKRNRWGDYAGIAIDPEDTNCFWMHHEYVTATANIWGTWIGKTCW